MASSWFIILLTVCSAQWTTHQKILPRSAMYMAVGAYNNTIYLLGGNNDRKQLIQYDITTATLIDNGTLALPADVYVISQGYTQIDNILYIIAGSAGGGKSFKIL
eukprot:458225_1